jgi:hypothetical protein
MIVKNILLGKGGNVVTIEPTTRELAVAQEALTTASRHRDVCQAEYDAAEIALEAALDGSGLGRDVLSGLLASDQHEIFQFRLRIREADHAVLQAKAALAERRKILQRRLPPVAPKSR